METFTVLKKLVDNPRYTAQRERSLHDLDIEAIDAPIQEMARSFARLPFCFTQQCCYGHFLYTGQTDKHNLELLPISENIQTVEYRIAYIAVCIESSPSGKEFLGYLEKIPAIDPEYIQFGCAQWFWKSQVNSYALQVEPQRFKHKDTCRVAYHEALHLETVKQKFFIHIERLLQEALSKSKN